MWLEQYPFSFCLMCLSGFALFVGVWLDDKRHERACGEQQQRFDAVRAE